MPWHRAMLEGMGTQREEPRGSHSPLPTPLATAVIDPPKVAAVSGNRSPHASASSPPAPVCDLEAGTSPSAVSLSPAPALARWCPLNLLLPPEPALVLPSALLLPPRAPPDPASSRRRRRTRRWVKSVDFLELKWGRCTRVIPTAQLGGGKRSWSLWITADCLYGNAGGTSRLGVFIVGGDDICIGKGNGGAWGTIGGQFGYKWVCLRPGIPSYILRVLRDQDI